MDILAFYQRFEQGVQLLGNELLLSFRVIILAYRPEAGLLLLDFSARCLGVSRPTMPGLNALITRTFVVNKVTLCQQQCL